MTEKTRAEKIRETSIRKYGSEEAWKAHQREAGLMASRNSGAKRGLANVKDPAKLKEISRLGHQARWRKDTNVPS